MAAQPPRAASEELAEFAEYAQLPQIRDGTDPSSVLQDYIEGVKDPQLLCSCQARR